MHGDIAVKNGRKGSLTGLRKAAPHILLKIVLCNLSGYFIYATQVLETSILQL